MPDATPSHQPSPGLPVVLVDPTVILPLPMTTIMGLLLDNPSGLIPALTAGAATSSATPFANTTTQALAPEAASHQEEQGAPAFS